MALPHFKPFLPNIGNVIFGNLCTVNFKDEYMRESCCMIYKKMIRFNINVYKDEVKPLDRIQEMIKNETKIDLEIEQYDKQGIILYYVVLENFYFVKFKGLIDFNWNSDTIKYADVKFKYEKITYLNSKNYAVYMRKLKLKKIGNSF